MPKFKKGKKQSVASALQEGPGYSHIPTQASPATLPVEPSRSAKSMKKNLRKKGGG